jgi:hypothetical protein
MSKFLLTTSAPTDQFASEDDLKVLNLNADNLVKVEEPTTDCPSSDHILVADKDENNVWTTSWMLKTKYENILANKSTEVIMKQRRNHLLKASDWTQNADVPDSISFAWRTYREDLRNITKQEGFPTAIVWPKEPTEFPKVEETVIPGISGKDGKDGKDGVDGKDGADGRDGAVGPQGPQGIQGLVGPKGEQEHPVLQEHKARKEFKDYLVKMVKTG